MPWPSGTAPQSLAEGTPPPASLSVIAQALIPPGVPVTADRPPRLASSANWQFQASDGGRNRGWTSADRPQKKRAVIRTSQHERVLDISANTSYDVPLAALNAYRNAATRVASSYPNCHLSWGVIAAIGQVESNHGRFGGASVLANGKTTPRIVGLPLNGQGVAAIRDTDNGVLDGDKVWDRAVGPMQFIPSTWAGLGVDGDGDGRRDPSDFDDAALSTGRYLCGAGGDFRSLGQARANVMRYNHSAEYVDLVLQIANAYDSGVVDVVPNDPPPPRAPQVRRQVHHPGQHPGRHRGHRPRTPDGTKGPRSKPTPHPSTPAPNSPKPSPKPGPGPQPKPHPDPKPPPTPKPPVVRTYTDVWTWVDAGSGTVGTFAVKLPLPAAVRATLTGDLDGDGDDTESLVKELEGLSGGNVTVQTTDGKVSTFTVNTPPTPPAATPTPPAPATTPPETPSTTPEDTTPPETASPVPTPSPVPPSGI